MNAYIHTAIGSVASQIPAPQMLRYCPMCNKESLEKNGEIYWHRAHQFQLSKFCPTHGILLGTSLVPFHPNGKHSFTAATIQNCPGLQLADVIPDQDMRLNSLLLDVLNQRFGASESFDIRKHYLQLMGQKGLVKGRCKIAAQKLSDVVQSYRNRFDFVYEELAPSRVSVWIGKLNTSRVYSLHPAIHMLVLRSLMDTPDCKSDDRLFGYAPWPCLNPVCPQYRQLVIRSVRTHVDRKSHKIIGIFQCNCGYTYTQNTRPGVDKSTDWNESSSVVDFGAYWKTKLSQYVKADYSLRECARRLKVDPKTVSYQAKRMGLHVLWKSGYHRHPVKKAISKDYRDTWRKLLNEPSSLELSVTQLRRIEPRVYTWLYLHDRKWLQENSPKKSCCATKTERIDWSSRDKLLSDKLIRIKSGLLLNNQYPKRITKALLSRLSGHQSWIYNVPHKFPLSCALLSQLPDTEDDYVIRKLKWLFATERKELPRLLPWQIQRKIGIRHMTSHVRELIANEFKFALVQYGYCTATQQRKRALRS